MSKIFDATMGFIIGDAMGVPVEFSIREKLLANPITEMKGFGSHTVPAGSWSDDSSMTLATMDSIAEQELIDYNDIMKKFYEWCVHYKYTPCNLRFDIGHTCAEAIYNYAKKNKEPLQCGLSDVKSNGNGSLMRILPIAFYTYYKKNNEQEIVNLTNNVSSLTHAHEISKLGCYIYVKYVHYLLDGYNKNEAYDLLKKVDFLSYYSKTSINAYSRVLYEDLKDLELKHIKSSAYIVDTLEASLWVLLKTDNFTQAIIGSINLGNDTDTIGAICGSLAGIIYGKNSMPERWLNKLLKKELIDDIIKRFEAVLLKNNIK